MKNGNMVRYRCFHLAFFCNMSGIIIASESSDQTCCAERNLLYRHHHFPYGNLIVVRIQRRRGCRFNFGESLPCSRCRNIIVSYSNIILNVAWSQRNSSELGHASPDCLPEPVMTALY